MQPSVTTDRKPPRIVTRGLELRCGHCNRLLAEHITPPYRIRCRCGNVSEATSCDVVELEIKQKTKP